LAEGVRFELTVPLPTRRISSPVHSTALPTFRGTARDDREDHITLDLLDRVGSRARFG
jgi:hypothetical protein